MLNGRGNIKNSSFFNVGEFSYGEEGKNKSKNPSPKSSQKEKEV